MIDEGLKRMLGDKFGLDPTILGERLVASVYEKRMQQLGINNLNAYKQKLSISPDEQERFVEGLLVPETWFFRDREPFYCLEKWAEGVHESHRILNILSAPCATGEETYSIAISLHQAGYRPGQYRIHAYDLDKRSIDAAKLGEYKPKVFREIYRFNRDNYFETTSEGLLRVKDEYRSGIHFEVENIATGAKIKRNGPYDVIFMRNVLIYMTEQARIKALKMVEELLVSDGLLFLGHADNLYGLTTAFVPYGSAANFSYTKKNDPIPIIKPIGQIENPSAYTLENQRDLLKDAEKLADRGDYILAHELIDQHLKKNNRNTKTLFLKAQIFCAEDKSEKAIPLLQRILFIEKNHVEALVLLESINRRGGNVIEANMLKSRRESILEKESKESYE